ncbi:HepT-like ribonuclease domain-containing protein [Maribellus mangrovi]|uniref:HepT-like ribonuclease domain-containing protein n=1 Tax=Maribellus mangrovi TaxID=3133146 RepID=UPI0030EB534D
MTLQGKKYLDDILYSIKLIESFMEDITTFEDYVGDLKTQSAVERQLGIIGEAANKYNKLQLGNALQNTHQIIGLRNRIIYAYDNINCSIIWAIIKNHIPKLEKEVLTRLS